MPSSDKIDYHTISLKVFELKFTYNKISKLKFEQLTEDLTYDFLSLLFFLKHNEGFKKYDEMSQRIHKFNFYVPISNYSSIKKLFQDLKITKNNYSPSNILSDHLLIDLNEENLNEQISFIINHYIQLSRICMIFDYIKFEFSDNLKNFKFCKLKKIFSFDKNLDNILILSYDSPLAKWNEICETNYINLKQKSDSYEIKLEKKETNFNSFSDIVKEYNNFSHSKENIYIFEFAFIIDYIEAHDELINTFLAKGFLEVGWKAVYNNITLKNIKKFNEKPEEIKWAPEFDIVCVDNDSILLIEMKSRMLEFENDQNGNKERKEIMHFLMKLLFLRSRINKIKIYGLFFTTNQINNLSFQENFEDFYIISGDTDLTKIGNQLPFRNPFKYY